MPCEEASDDLRSGVLMSAILLYAAAAGVGSSVTKVLGVLFTGTAVVGTQAEDCCVREQLLDSLISVPIPAHTVFEAIIAGAKFAMAAILDKWPLLEGVSVQAYRKFLLRDSRGIF
jgi:hypothetical protein